MQFTEWYTENVYPEFVFTPKTKDDLVGTKVRTRYWDFSVLWDPWT